MSDWAYDDHHCALCGVSFNIGRIRTASESRTGAWSWIPGTSGGQRHNFKDYYWSNLEWAGGCPKRSGCMLAVRLDVHSGSIRRRGERATWSDEPVVADVQNFPGGNPSECVQIIYGSSRQSDCLRMGDYNFWRNNQVFNRLQSYLQEAGYYYLADATDPNRIGLAMARLEHIAGPGHQKSTPHGFGYDGNHISAQEMSMCNIAQCLKLKQCDLTCVRETGQTSSHSKESSSPDHGQSDEAESRPEWCLSSLYVRYPLVFVSPDNVRSVRSASWSRDLVYWDWIRAEGEEGYMEFHPACLEVFKRAAIRRHRKFELEKLGQWFLATHAFRMKLPRHEAVLRGIQRTSWGGKWIHRRNDEWLVADPCRILGLQAIIGSLKEKPLRSKRHDRGLEKTEAGFSSLPADVLFQVFEHLQIESVATTAIAIPPLYDLINRYFRIRLTTEWAHVWELWCELPYSAWIGNEMCEASFEIEHVCYTGASPPKSTSFNLSQMVAESALKGALEQLSPEVRPSNPAAMDSTRALDLVELVLRLDQAIKSKELQGLENRSRIWDDCEQILDQIDILDRHMEGEWDVQARKAEGRWTMEDSKMVEALLYPQTPKKQERERKRKRKRQRT